MPKQHILVVDDEEDILELVSYNLRKEGYGVTAVTTGEGALRVVRDDQPGLVLLDLMLPNVSGLEVCRTLKRNAETQSIPIIMLTAKGEEADIVAGLEAGADDYVTKPFSPRVLLARVKAVLRRKVENAVEQDDAIVIQSIVIHPGRHEVFVDGKPVDLTLTEYGLLECLARRPGWVLTRYQIIEAVRGDNYPVTDRSVDVHVVSLRRKLGSAGAHIETVRGIGYRFKE
jgi:two-component system phosphate regulon response regulator PhoB